MKNGCCGGLLLSKGDIEKWVLELVKKHGNDPLRICRQEGIRVIYVDDLRDDWSGFLYRETPIWIIGVNCRCPAALCSTALAHELAHYAILKNIHIETKQSTSLEKLCDHGAKVLLFGRTGVYNNMERVFP